MDTLSTVADSTPDYDIYTGVWTDWSRGQVFGATLTSTRTSGSLLIAFLSLFVTVVGTHFWRIGCFVFHYTYSTESSRDALYHQRQAVLRNSANAASGLASLFQMIYAWQRPQARHGNTTYRRILPLIVFPFLTLVAFAVASTFSSRISTITGNAVLVSGTDCGVIRLRSNENDTEFSTLLLPYLAQLYASSATYAQQCYIKPRSTQGCNTFVQKSLSSTITRNASCPFANDICKTRDSNIILDTGYLDSHQDFGLNAPSSSRYQFRRVIHCAPLVTEGYKEAIPNLHPTLHTPYMRYYYGQRMKSNNTNYNFTYEHAILQKDQFKLEDFTGPMADFDITVTAANYINGSLDAGNSAVAPIKRLERTDADIYLIFLSANAVLFSQPVDDLWYSAHELAGVTAHKGTDGLSKVYWSDEVSSPLGCTVQYQFCNPALEKSVGCTPLSGVGDAYHAAQSLWREGGETEKLKVIYRTMFGALDNFMAQLEMLGSSGLDSFARKQKGGIGQLPRDQWQRDVEKWNNMSLAFIQQGFVGMAAGPSNSQISDRWLDRPDTEAEKQLCKNQKIFSTAYTNFSVFGLATILLVGGLIVVVSYALEPFVAWLQRRRNLDVYARLEWTMNETLQLQRLAHEELGLGAWHRCDKDVPITEGEERLGVLDLSDRTHPRLKAPPASYEDVLEEEVEKRRRGSVPKATPVVDTLAVESGSSTAGGSDGDVSPLQQSYPGVETLGGCEYRGGSHYGAGERSA